VLCEGARTEQASLLRLLQIGMVLLGQLPEDGVGIVPAQI
jgi:hypothetical protein